MKMPSRKITGPKWPDPNRTPRRSSFLCARWHGRACAARQPGKPTWNVRGCQRGYYVERRADVRHVANHANPIQLPTTTWIASDGRSISAWRDGDKQEAESFHPARAFIP